MTTEKKAISTQQMPPVEDVYAEELAFLAHWDTGPKPPGFHITPRAVVIFITGSPEKLHLAKDQKVPATMPRSMEISEKFVGNKSLVERSVVTLAGGRGLLLAGEPGTAKSMLSELLAAAISRSSQLTIQGTAGTTEEQLKYGWNYAQLIAKGPHKEAMVPSPVLTAMRQGSICRLEEVTRCLPEVQDALVSVLSDRRMAIPELEQIEFANRGFNIIATANLRDRGVSEMSSALKRRLNFETVSPIGVLAHEIALVKRQAISALAEAEQVLQLDDAVLEALVTVFRDLRNGQSTEGWSVEKPTTVMSTAEAVQVASAMGLSTAYFSTGKDPLALLPEYLMGVVMKDEPKDRGRLLTYWDAIIKRRSEGDARLWKQLYDLRSVLEDN